MEGAPRSWVDVGPEWALGSVLCGAKASVGLCREFGLGVGIGIGIEGHRRGGSSRSGDADRWIFQRRRCDAAMGGGGFPQGRRGAKANVRTR